MVICGNHPLFAWLGSKQKEFEQTICANKFRFGGCLSGGSPVLTKGAGMITQLLSQQLLLCNWCACNWIPEHHSCAIAYL